VGRGRALMLAGAGTVLTTAEAERHGLVDVVLPRAEFAAGWRALAESLATPAAAEIKKVMAGGLSAAEAARCFARLWVADAHWAAADRVLARAKS
ncbi:MAG: enoyl-CoA hydratase/isomerase family protein, partial [Streptomycetaceae bacterium]|nr:enoyl-CoA hydratase/isomerase family protein [Streptomycetaceae bacterium]